MKALLLDPYHTGSHAHMGTQVAQGFLYSRPAPHNPRAHVERFFIKSEHSIVSFFRRIGKI